MKSEAEKKQNNRKIHAKHQPSGEWKKEGERKDKKSINIQ
jgi:hypothetical protein